jgi:hypothetical protein
MLALAALATTAVFRPAVVEGQIREGRVEIPARQKAPANESLGTSPQVDATAVVETVRAEKPGGEKAVLPVAALPTKSKISAGLEKMLSLFERELELSPDQRQRMEQILARREQEISELQAGIVNSGVFRVREYDFQVRQLQAVSYEEIAGVLDGMQRRRWTRLMAEGRLGDAVLFEVPQAIVVLED